jgi:integrase
MQTLREICDELYFNLNLRIASEKTRYQYAIALRCFAEHLGHQPTIDDLTDNVVTLWMGRLLRREPKLSINTVRERVNRILALWAWLARQGMVRKWPTVIKPPAPDPLPLALTEEQLRSLFRSAGKERGSIGDIPADLWWTSFLGFVWNTSERKSAALAVRLEWLNIDAGTVAIPPASRKGGRKWGVYKLWGSLLPMIRACIDCQPARQLVWPWPKCDGSYYTSYNRILKDAGIPVNRQTKTHGLRVSHATWLKVAGGDPTRRLGHSSAETTSRHYLDPRQMPDHQPQLFEPWRQPPAA